MKEFFQRLQEIQKKYPGTDGSSFLLTKNEPMARHTTFRIGGAADFYAEPDSPEALVALLREAAHSHVEAIVIGRGSNLLFDDAGYRGLVVATSALRELRCEGNRMTACAGVPLLTLTKTACAASLTGLEFAYGIPGSCGGAVFMNAGAYGGEMADVVLESTYYDRETDRIVRLDAAAHAFGYRESFYRTHPNAVLLWVTFSLSMGEFVQIQAKMDDFMHRRVEKQPLEYPSAGSVFKRYPGRYTAQMIDEAGLKGYTVGGAQISEKHAGFIVNRGNATARDVLELVEYIRETLRERFSVEIEMELVYVPPRMEDGTDCRAGEIS